MELPIINRLSGTQPSDLLESYIEAKRAVDAAVKAMGAVWPHARDYQGGNIRQAFHEHAERLRHVNQVALELGVIAEGIVTQL
jgi:hypothetical protein